MFTYIISFNLHNKQTGKYYDYSYFIDKAKINQDTFMKERRLK